MAARRTPATPPASNPMISPEAIAAAAEALDAHHVPYTELGSPEAPYYFCTGCDETFQEYPENDAHPIEMALRAALPFLRPAPAPAVDDVETIVIYPAGETGR